MKHAAAAFAALLGAAAPAAHAAQIIAFGQTSGSNTITATPNGANTATTLSADSAGVNVTQLLGLSPISGAFFSIDATSIDPVTAIGSALLQHYAGSFCITTAASCGGTNILSGTFSDAAFGLDGGPGLVVTANNPPDTLSLTSDLLAASDLLPPSTLDLGFSNLTPALGVIGTTLSGFTASFAGAASSSAAAVPEPGSLALLGMGLVALGAIRRRGGAPAS